MDNNDYEEKLREIRVALNRIPKYMENSELKKTIENAQRVAAALGNMVVAISQSEAVKAFGRLAEQLSNIKLPQLSEEAKEGLENYHYLNKLESLQWPLYFWVSKELMQELAPYTSISEENKDEISTIVYKFCTAEFIDGLLMDWNNSTVMDRKRIPILQEAISLYNSELYYGCVSILACQLNGIITDIYNMQVGMYAMEKKTINVDAVKENFSINHEQAENVIKQLETIGFLDKGDESGNHKVMMDKEAFQNRIRGYQDLADRMRAVAASKHMNLSDVTISKTLIQTENERAVKTRIPGTWGEKARYVWIKKENIMEIHSGKTMLTFIDREKDYKIYDKDNRVVETMRGEALYSNHYDKVESSVRKRYEKSQVETETKVKTATKTTTQRKR